LVSPQALRDERPDFAPGGLSAVQCIAIVTFAARPTRARSCLRRTTIQVVKAYKIQRIKGGMEFTCTQCAHSVSTLDFDAKAGNLRTQAATAINDHVTKAHHAPMIISPSDSQQRTWR
jgi:hypothetical protein